MKTMNFLEQKALNNFRNLFFCNRVVKHKDNNWTLLWWFYFIFLNLITYVCFDLLLLLFSIYNIV